MTPEEAQAAAAQEFNELMHHPETHRNIQRAAQVCDILLDDGVDVPPVLLMDAMAYAGLRLCNDYEGYSAAAFIGELTNRIYVEAPEALS